MAKLSEPDVPSRKTYLASEMPPILFPRGGWGTIFIWNHLARKSRARLLIPSRRGNHLARGLGLIWNCTTRGLEPLPPSLCHGVRSPLATQIPRPFQPARASSIRPSRPFA